MSLWTWRTSHDDPDSIEAARIEIQGDFVVFIDYGGSIIAAERAENVNGLRRDDR